MILPLRRRHRRIFAVMGVLLPVAFVTGVAARKPIPTMALLSTVLPTQESFSASQWDRSDLFTNVAFRVQLLRGASNNKLAAMRISAPEGFVKADVLVYWLPARSTLKDVIPDNAILFGALISGQPMPFSPGLIQDPGVLILYSLADHETIAVSKPFGLL